VERRYADQRLSLRHAHPVLDHAEHHVVHARLLGQSLAPGRSQLHQHAHGVWCFHAPDRSEGELPRSYLERLYNIQRWTVFSSGGHFAPAEEPAAVAGDLTAFFRA